MEELEREAALPVGRSGPVFDPNAGAAGRPSPFYERHGGPPSVARGASVWLSPDQRRTKLKWNGFYLTVEFTIRKCLVYTIDLAPDAVPEGRDESPRRAGNVTEAALFVSSWARDPVASETNRARIYEGSLHFLDARGYAVFVVAEVACLWRDVAHVLDSAGVTFSVYAVPCGWEAGRKIASLLFPHRAGCTVLY